MSWSISVVGNPDNIVKHLREQSAKLTGQSKIEYDDALPHIEGLVNQTFRTELGATKGHNLSALEVQASGSGSAEGETQLSRSCSVSIKPTHFKVV